jgi:hypothetical protein
MTTTQVPPIPPFSKLLRPMFVSTQLNLHAAAALGYRGVVDHRKFLVSISLVFLFLCAFVLIHDLQLLVIESFPLGVQNNGLDPFTPIRTNHICDPPV